MSKVFKLRDRFEWMKRQRVVKEASSLYQDLRERGRGRDRERDWSFCIFSKISLSRLKAAGCNLFALTFSFAKTLLLFFFSLRVTRYSRFSARLNEEISSSSEVIAIRPKCRHSRSYASNRVHIRLKNFAWEIPRGSARVEICCRRECFARETIREMKIQEYKSWSELHRIVIVRKISFRKIKKKKGKTRYLDTRFQNISRGYARSFSFSYSFIKNFPTEYLSIRSNGRGRLFLSSNRGYICGRTVSQP